ncbi:MAG: M28 family metallopeptidase [Pseudomonadota bacterium]
MIRRSVTIAAALAFSACSQQVAAPTAETPPATIGPATPSALLLPLPSETSADITEADLHARIAPLADDIFEGRAPGSVAGEASADWIAADMARVGLSPAGDDGTWFQTVGMVEQTLVEDQSGLTISNGDEDTDLQLGTDAVIWTKRQADLEYSFDESEIVFVGYGVVAPEYGWDDYAGVDAEGKTVVMLVNDPGFANPDGELFKGKSMTYYGRWTYKFEEAARQGATAAIVIHETAPASYGWDVVSNSWSGAQADLVRAGGGVDRTMMEAWISNEYAETLFSSAGLDFSEMKDAAQTSGFAAVDMGNLTASGDIVQTVDRLESRNVVGVLEGKTTPDEYVLYTAHWDHMGKKTGEKTGAPGEDFYQDDIFNGAVDNASGTAAILEIAEAMAQQDLDRSVLFLAVTLEESGLLGSAYYAENPTVPLNKIVAGINIDAMLPMGRAKNMIVVGYGASELEDRLATILEGQDRVIEPDPTPEAGYFYRSDHISFAKKGVPMLYADGGQDLREGGVAAGKAFADVYTAQRYHKPMDEYAANWTLEGMVEDIDALYQLGRDLAASGDWPEWYDGNEFKAIREASLASAE